MPQLLPPELPRHGPPALVAVLLMDELGCTQQLLYRLMAWVGAAEMAQVGAGGDAASVCLCSMSGCRVLDEHEFLAPVMPSLCPLGHTQSVPSCGTALGKVLPPSSWESPSDPLRTGTGIPSLSLC